MSKSAEDRIRELESALKQREDVVSRMRDNYNEVHRRMSDAEKTAMYYRGQAENAAFADTPSDSVGSHSDDSHSVPQASPASSGDLDGAVQRAIEQMIAPRLEQVERFATDALQQTAGREVDRALQNFREKHPESSEIMDFERLVLMDASDEIRRRQQGGEPVEDIRSLAVDVAKKRVTAFNDMREKRSKENERRREEAQKKRMLPDVFAAAGMEEAPTAPSSKQEAGDLLDRLVGTTR
tara:strand:+ start:19 stop:735 length:717 start_codon:yes stop_codon:yes gene_type:complete